MGRGEIQSWAGGDDEEDEEGDVGFNLQEIQEVVHEEDEEDEEGEKKKELLPSPKNDSSPLTKNV